MNWRATQAPTVGGHELSAADTSATRLVLDVMCLYKQRVSAQTPVRAYETLTIQDNAEEFHLKYSRLEAILRKIRA
jgi:hypothetical protein